MAVITGSTRFGFWFVEVEWSGDTVFRVQFSRTRPDEGPVPSLIRLYLSGRPVDLSLLRPGAVPPGELYAEIYREVRSIPYGETATYGEIAARTGTGPRVVGQAMARNPVALVIPCHRVVSRSGPGGFSPDPEIKIRLLNMERKNKKRFTAEDDFSHSHEAG
ncbi:MAG: methylated-DNA--[protein]-cysteine S-methyltransferase [Methanomicrobiales archaeon]|nr:methylated-DNA--[protein]-cysteine S-methyltransferase [Methanomicrobiales archaeon]NYT20731.1 methylated-DNA--[protein]-cysteine S-methyltransferase [Methanomicrobiales archaeon]